MPTVKWLATLGQADTLSGAEIASHKTKFYLPSFRMSKSDICQSGFFAARSRTYELGLLKNTASWSHVAILKSGPSSEVSRFKACDVSYCFY